jgi:hypothetical protein
MKKCLTGAVDIGYSITWGGIGVFAVDERAILSGNHVILVREVHYGKANESVVIVRLRNRRGGRDVGQRFCGPHTHEVKVFDLPIKAGSP